MKERRKGLDSRETAIMAARILNNKKGIDIKIIDIGEKSSFADYLVMASGTGERQIGTLADYVEDGLAGEGVTVRNIEGKKESGWILMDYGDIIVNILTREMRERYNIEKVWADCDMETPDDWQEEA